MKGVGLMVIAASAMLALLGCKKTGVSDAAGSALRAPVKAPGAPRNAAVSAKPQRTKPTPRLSRKPPAPVLRPAAEKKPDPVAYGKRLTMLKGCVACHTTDGKKSTGPTFKGLYGSKRTVVTKGKTRIITANDTYIIRSIQNPNADIVKGYEKVAMVTLPITLHESSALVAYIKTLK